MRRLLVVVEAAQLFRLVESRKRRGGGRVRQWRECRMRVLEDGGGGDFRFADALARACTAARGN